jgi:kynurenine formamidase
MFSNFQFIHKNQAYQFNPNEPLDISLAIKEGNENPNCYYAESPHFETIRAGDFVGSVAEGGSVNYQKISLTPHGNGTHTECYGHISSDKSATIYHCLTKFWFMAEVVSLSPQNFGSDLIIRLNDLQGKLKTSPEALIIRTLPNGETKKIRQYSGTNPPYLEPSIGAFLAEAGVKHLLVDLPSVDKEVDGGKLAVHRGFWQFPEKPRKDCTITELIFVNNQIPDGVYLLNLQIISLLMDASPSKPILYKLSAI